MNKKIAVIAALMAVVIVSLSGAIAADAKPPKFTLDGNWPKQLPDKWELGQVTGMYGDQYGLVWISNQSNRLDEYELGLARGEGECCRAAPQVIAFDQAGNVVKSWNVSAPSKLDTSATRMDCGEFKCLTAVHTIYVDHKGNVWVSGNGAGDSQVLKFDNDGKFLLQIGGSSERGCCGNQDTENVTGGTGIAVWPATNEVFVTDGYYNRRVIVFDADTGKFKRMWGAYGKPPEPSVLTVLSPTGPGPRGERMLSPEPTRVFEGPGANAWSTVHGVAISNDGVVWVADRRGNRLQQFKLDGTYIREAFISRKTTLDQGTVYGFAFSPDQKYVYIPDGPSKRVHILDTKSLEEVGSVGYGGGQMPGTFNHLHDATTDKFGNLYTGEASAGARIQRWKLVK